jgi:Domain of unknown function (DUF4159)
VRFRARAKIAAAVLSLLLLSAAVLLSQRSNGGRNQNPQSELPAQGDFHFIRTEYSDRAQYGRGFGFSSRGGRGRGWWNVDWPEADEHFSIGVKRLTRIDVGAPRTLAIADDSLYDHPWIYLTQAGYWSMPESDVPRLREYLLRGGFLMVDDFWSQEEWESFADIMNRVLPGQPIDDIQLSDSVMHVLFTIEQKDLTFIPGSRHLRRGAGGSVVVQQPPGSQPAWRSIEDGKHRMVVAVNFDTDVADAWEFADVPYYPAEMTTLAYRYGVNYIVYAMTH